MTTTLHPTHTNTTGAAEPVPLDGRLFFQPLPVIEQARQLAAVGTGLLITLPLDQLDAPRLTGVTRQLLEASMEARLRAALTAAGYRTITPRRDVHDAMMLEATPHATGTGEAAWLDGRLFFQPLPVIRQARQLAADGTGLLITLPLDQLDAPRLTGVTRQLLEASMEARLRAALTAAGYRTITPRRDVHDAMMLDATT